MHIYVCIYMHNIHIYIYIYICVLCVYIYVYNLFNVYMC
jgi:hypothetical protein